MKAVKKRVVIAGFGDTGLLVAIHLSKYFEVIGISPKPCLLSGQELGARITKPEVWQRDYLMPYSRYKKLQGVTIHQGLVENIDTQQQQVTAVLADGQEIKEHYDALLIASGVSNGFWRQPTIENLQRIKQQLQDQAKTIESASSLAVIGGGATGVSSALNIALRYPQKSVQLFYSQQQVLPGYHPKVRHKIEQQLRRCGVVLKPGHRAQIPANFNCDELSSEPVHWSSGQTPCEDDLFLWAVGKVQANNSFIPAEMLNAEGFVITNSLLQVANYDNIFAVGDIAATDDNRSSARNWGFRLAANNIRAQLQQRPIAMQHYKASPYRWGSIVGLQDEGLRVFQPDGGSFRFPNWSVRSLLFPLAVHRGIYKGVRRANN